MKDPNTIKIYYQDGVVMAPHYATISNLFKGLKAEVRNLQRRRRAGKPLPTKIIITFDRRLR